MSTIGPLLLVTLFAAPPGEDEGAAEDLSAVLSRGDVQHDQAWGVLGIDVAASDPKRAPARPLRLGDTEYRRGLGHHARGKIVVELAGAHVAFRALVGVQWQGGGRGSVVFRVEVDGKQVFRVGPLSDSDPPCPVDISLAGARELRLLADDAGDGIGCDMANWVEARLIRDRGWPIFGKTTVRSHGEALPEPSPPAGGLSLLAAEEGPQLAIASGAGRLTVGIREGEELQLAVPVRALGSIRVRARVRLTHGESAVAELSLLDGLARSARLRAGESRAIELEVASRGDATDTTIVLTTREVNGAAGVRWEAVRCLVDGRSASVPLALASRPASRNSPPRTPPLRVAIERELIEWDWRLEDGIGTPREPRSWVSACRKTLRRGRALLADLQSRGVDVGDFAAAWDRLERECDALATSRHTETAGEELWRRVHGYRRRLVFRNPLADTGPLLFVKRVPSCFSHQLTQYYGKCARPGGGLFVLEEPGRSMRCRQLTADLPAGSFQQPEVSFDGQRVLFAFVAAEAAPSHWQSNPERHYHVFEIATDGSGLRQLTHGPFDDFAPRYLPDGRILFLSTRRGGFHRCGAGPCPVYTLAQMEADGSRPRVISYHETNEWDPVLLHDGRVLYTRWDYVDRSAVFYQQLWTVRPDGSDVRAFYGNNTLNPVGVWEARPVPGSHRIVATAAAHHAITAGSVILIDPARGADGLGPVTRLTPDVLFPESEFPVGRWHAPAGVPTPPEVPTAERRWPGHSYRSPFPLSDSYFLAAYSFEPLLGEPHANKANLFGLYLVDRFGNKELLYRDPNIGSLWPVPLRARERPPALPSTLEATAEQEGSFFVENVYESWPRLSAHEEDRIIRLRVVQVLPKSTPHINQPRLGLANASPGKQVLGTVPVESDGSAYFRAPAGVALCFQALDRQGRAVQTMRSVTYLQAGETVACVGCHERRSSVPPARALSLAARRPPSPIERGPKGSKPFSYPLLVQPILDRHCVRCHGEREPAGGIALTGDPAGGFSVSYLALAPRVPYSEWKSGRSFLEANCEPMTWPGFFGARASKLLDLILDGHEDVKLGADELERVVTWMDTNALFYGTFEPEDQRRQQRGEVISGPAIE